MTLQPSADKPDFEDMMAMTQVAWRAFVKEQMRQMKEDLKALSEPKATDHE